MQQGKQFGADEQRLNLSEWPAGIEYRILSDYRVLHTKCQRYKTDFHGAEGNLASKAIPQLSLDLRTITVHIYKGRSGKECNDYENCEDPEADNDLISHIHLPGRPKMALI